MRAETVVLGLAVLVVALTLQGCGSSGGGGGASGGDTTTTAPTTTSADTTTTTTTTKKVPPSGWNLSPVEVRGSHLYDSGTGKQFYAKGMGLPNVGEDINDWIDVLQRIRNESKEVNVLRIYQPPACALEGGCFEPFMKEADSLGFYVLVPGTGTSWGWLPGPDACKPDMSAEDCYKAGGVLGFGQKVIQHFNYPNTLAIVIGNEFDQQMFAKMPVLKAYARDMKAHMRLCNSEQDSPTNGQMRMIPLMYASSDDRGDKAVQPKADYMFCGNYNASVDIFGLNVERWCRDEDGKTQYTGINNWVAPKAYPGAFVFSEMGCARNGLPPELKGSRSWNQVVGFFQNFPAFDGFFAYTYFGNPDFNMFDGAFANATRYQDGTNFFERLQKIGAQDHHEPAPTQVPECAKEILGSPIEDFNEVPIYDTGDAGWAKNCPLPWGKKAPVESAAFVF